MTRTIHIALYRGRSIVSGCIRWISWGEYSHAAIVLPEEDGIMFESWDGVGVRLEKSISDGHSAGTKVDVFSLMVDDLQYDVIVKALQSQIGKDYDYLGVFRFVPFFRLFLSGKPSKSEQGRWFCSEYICWALNKAGVNL